MLAIFDRHHSMTRFAIVIGVGGLLAILGVAMGVAGRIAAKQERFATTPLYTDDIDFGDGLSAQAVGVWSSSDGTRVFEVVKLDDETVAKMPTDAGKYTVTVAAIHEDQSVTRMAVVPTATLYVYGSTGYMGVCLTAGEAFRPQYVQTLFETKDTDGDDVSFTVTINPAAEDMPTSKALDGDGFDAGGFYRVSVAPLTEEALRGQATEDLGEMYSAQQTMTEYLDRLDRAGVSTDGMIPAGIAGDAVEETDDGYEAKLATTVPAGLNIDWQPISIADGGSYKKAAFAATGTRDYGGLVAWLVGDSQREGAADTVSSDPSVWHMKDGRTLEEAGEGMSGSSYADVTASVGELAGAAASYASAKTAYQTDDMLALVAFENDVDGIADALTESGDNVYVYAG